MNDLTKEAIRRQQQDWEIDLKTYMSSAHYGNALARPNIDPSFGRPKYGAGYLDPDRPLTGKPGDYLTGYEGSRCDRIDVPHETTHGFDIETYSDGYSEGVAAGMTLMEPNMEESRTGINLDRINRVSDDYRGISDDVEKETNTWKSFPDENKPF